VAREKVVMENERQTLRVLLAPSGYRVRARTERGWTEVRHGLTLAQAHRVFVAMGGEYGPH